MIYDIDAPPWWRYAIPLREGEPVRVYYKHRVRGWSLVRDPSGPRRVYWQDNAGKVRRFTPPPYDKEIGCQTGEGLFLPDRGSPAVNTAEPDTWSLLRDSVSHLTLAQQSVVYSRVVRFIELGWHDLRA